MPPFFQGHSPNFVSFLFIKTALCYPNNLGCAVFHWSTYYTLRENCPSLFQKLMTINTSMLAVGFCAPLSSLSWDWVCTGSVYDVTIPRSSYVQLPSGSWRQFPCSCLPPLALTCFPDVFNKNLNCLILLIKTWETGAGIKACFPRETGKAWS